MRTTYLISCAFIPIISLGQTSSGSIQGSVTAEDGTRISSAVIRYQRITRNVVSGRNLVPAPGEAVIFSQASTDANGSFLVSSLPIGDYALCVDVATAPYLNPCLWSSAVKVRVSALEISRPSLALKTGVFLKVPVNDPLGLLPSAPDGALGGSNLLIGVTFGKGGYHGAQRVGTDRNGRDYRIAIPVDIPLRLWVFSRHVILTDAAGASLDGRGAQIPIQPKLGQDMLVTLTVSGRIETAAQ